MSRYIDADELIVIGLDDPDCGHQFKFVPWEFIEDASTADVVEVKHGEWIKFDEGDCYCSNCGITLEDWVQGIFYKFCPNCGADMRERGEE